ncbi:MAG: gluconate 2-dehydrogenase subunit 3 family protein [Gammaproteobacteria bacterium]|nr:gluconate 2-dehydrogenase subunit 3 family protein [Gammaproteobacteria bacterium]
MNRREFMQCATLLITGASASQLGFTLTPEQERYLANAPDYIRTPVDYLSPAQRRIIAAMAEIVIPRTATPGAIDAGVPAYIELMAADWFNDQERAIFTAGLRDMEQRIPQEYSKPFDELNATQQLDIMEQLEDAASDSPWYDFANVQRQFISDAPFICQIKELTVWGFFTSEVGAKQVLRYNPMPMRFDGELPLSPDDSSWAGTAF